MATRAIKPKRDEGPLRHFPPLAERAPSLIRDDQPTPGRVIALVGLLLVAMGGLGMLAPDLGLHYIVSVAWGRFFLTLGVGGMLFHAFGETDLQFRRTYGALGLALFAGAVLLRLWPVKSVMGAMFLSTGVPCLGLALPFLLSFSRHETDPLLRSRVKALIGGAGIIMALAGFTIGSLNPPFLIREGVIFILFGLVYVSSYIGMEGASSDKGYFTGLGLGAIGFVFFVTAFARSFVLADAPYTVPDGLLLMAGGGLYLFVGLCICVDWPFMVLVRRELASFFFSPVGYLVLLGFVLIGWYKFWIFVMGLVRPGQNIFPEPIVLRYLWGLETIIFMIFAVPMLTMRLLSEEQRTGTWEVLLTAPVSESTVVLSKFVAVLMFFMIGVSTWGINLIALRAFGQEPFDYRPLLSFFITLVCTGAGFLSIGLFFSSLTKNQIIAAALTFAVMLLLTGLSAVIQYLQTPGIQSPWAVILRYVSYLDLFWDSLNGVVSPRHLLVFISIAAYFLFLTVKVLESRKWK